MGQTDLQGDCIGGQADLGEFYWGTDWPGGDCPGGKTDLEGWFCTGDKMTWTVIVLLTKQGKTVYGQHNILWIRYIINDRQFEDLLVGPGKIDWKAFKDVVDNLLGNYRATNDIWLVNKLLTVYKTIKCHMLTSPKIHSLRSLLNVFPKNLGAVSDEYGQWFHQHSATIEKHIRGTGIHWGWLTIVGHCSKMHQTNTNKNQLQSTLALLNSWSRTIMRLNT